jgi:hypothetical protein
MNIKLSSIMKFFDRKITLRKIVREIVTMIMLHIGTVRGNGERLYICKNYSTKLGPQQYCHYPHIESRVSDRWETEIVTFVYYTTKFFHHFYH